MYKLKNIIILFVLIFIINDNYNACTTFIISGKHTKDGKPILFKNRDTDSFDNSIAFFNDGKYNYVALVNAKDDWKEMVWGGYNNVGFAIINSVSFINKKDDTSKLVDQEGIIMKLALKNCKTLKDFETLLNNLPKPMGLNTNFGVIDAYGGAAYYETSNFGFTKFDVNDITIAPKGYLARTNHSFSGNLDIGIGFCRYQTECSALDAAFDNNQFNPQYLFNNISRNLTHPYTKTNLWDNLPNDKSTQDIRFFIDYIPMYNSASSIMIVGAGNEKQIDNTVMWAILGFPLSSVAIPVWLSKGNILPKVATMKSDLHSPLCDAALILKKDCFPINRDNGHNYINLSVVINKQNNGYLQLLKPIEDNIFSKANVIINNWDKSQISKNDIENYYNWLDAYLYESYNKFFNIKLYQ